MFLKYVFLLIMKYLPKSTHLELFSYDFTIHLNSLENAQLGNILTQCMQ